MRITEQHVGWWTAKLQASDRADVKLFYLDFTERRDGGSPRDGADPLGLMASASTEAAHASASSEVASSASSACASSSASTSTSSPSHATWRLPQLLWAARLISCDERTLWECIGLRFRCTFEHRVDSWNEQLAVKLVHYFLDAFAADDDGCTPRLRTRLSRYAAHAIAPVNAQLTACDGLQTKLDTLAATTAGPPHQDAAAAAVPSHTSTAADVLRTSAATVVPMEVGNAHSEGCLACRRTVPAFGELLRVPREAMFFRETVLEHCALARAMRCQPALFESILSNEEALLVLCLIFEQFVRGQTQSHWSLLLSGCPSSYPTVPSFWTFTDLAVLEGTDVLDDVINKKTELQSFHEQVLAALPVIYEALQSEAAGVTCAWSDRNATCDADDAATATDTTRTMKTITMAQLTREDFTARFSYEALLWARATFDSRAFKLNIDGEVRLSLVPIADMINHDNRSDVLIRRVDDRTVEDGGFVMQVGAAITEDSVRSRRELWMSYGPLQNWELLQFYGFVLENNEHDKLPFPFTVAEPTTATDSPSETLTTVEAALEEMDTDADRLAWWQRRRQRLMDRYSLFMVNRCWVRANGVPCEALLALLRVHLAQAEEFPSMEANSPFTPLSVSTETAVLDAVRETVECVLAQFATTLEDDTKELSTLQALLHESSTDKGRRNAREDDAIIHNDNDNEKAAFDDAGGNADSDEADPHAWDNYILSLRLLLGLKHIAQRTLEWCSAQGTV